MQAACMLKASRRRFLSFTGFVLCVAAAGVHWGCSDPASQIEKGASEERVRELLGSPTVVLKDPVDVKGYLVDAEDCAKLSVKVLVYDRSAFREDEP